jgi:hypothetical protein
MFAGKSTTVFFALTSLALTMVVLRLTGGFLTPVAPDVLFGPFDAAGCRLDSSLSFGQALIVLGLAILCVHYLPARIRRLNGIVCGLVLITAVDITIANRWMLADVPATVFSSSRPRLEALQTELQQRERVGPPTFYRSRNFAFDPDWQQQGSEQRLGEIVNWQRETLFPKHNLESGIRLIGSFSSIWPLAYEDLLSSLEAWEAKPEKYWGRKIPGQQATDAGWVAWVDAFATGRVTVKLEDSEGYAYQWNTKEPDFVLLAEPAGAMDDIDVFTPVNPDSVESKANLKILKTTNQSLQFSVETDQRRFLLCQFWDDGNWIAQIRNLDSDESSRQPLEEFSEFWHGVVIEPGSYSIEFVYQPTGFWIGAWVSGVSWLILGLASIAAVRRDRG